jgi:hypothetical protein
MTQSMGELKRYLRKVFHLNSSANIDLDGGTSALLYREIDLLRRIGSVRGNSGVDRGI